MIIKTNPCVMCGETAEVEVDPVGYDRWKNGELIQVGRGSGIAYNRYLSRVLGRDV